MKQAHVAAAQIEINGGRTTEEFADDDKHVIIVHSCRRLPPARAMQDGQACYHVRFFAVMENRRQNMIPAGRCLCRNPSRPRLSDGIGDAISREQRANSAEKVKMDENGAGIVS